MVHIQEALLLLTRFPATYQDQACSQDDLTFSSASIPSISTVSSSSKGGSSSIGVGGFQLILSLLYQEASFTYTFCFGKPARPSAWDRTGLRHGRLPPVPLFGLTHLSLFYR